MSAPRVGPPESIALGTPISGVPGLKVSTARGLSALGLTNVGKLIAHLPMRLEREEEERPISGLVAGQVVSARGEVTATRVVRRGSRPRFEAVLMDDSGRLDLVWFNQVYMADRVLPGMVVRVQGRAKKFGPGLQVANPRLEVIRAEKGEPALRMGRLRPVYPASEAVDSREIEAAVGRVLPAALPLIEDHLPVDLRRARELPELREAYRMIHAPRTPEEWNEARRRLAYDELLLLQLGVHMRRWMLRDRTRAPALRWSDAIDRHIRARLPFALTPAQDAVVKEIAGDLARPTPCNRLIQGDVGSGKTVVAVYAMLMAAASGRQAAMMSPTEILAEQHAGSISRMLAGSTVRVELLTGATPQGEREEILARVARGEVDILVGTHALLTPDVRFKDLAVVVIDEQHRFGVHQRAVLREKGAVGPRGAESGRAPHVLVMTATPIPRSLALTLFGDLDVSLIRGLPPGRSPVATRVVGPELRDAVYAQVRERLDAGEQAYIVVPTIDPASEKDQGAGSVRSLFKRLEDGALAGKCLAALHGRLKRATREAAMERFRLGQIDAMVATTVIEVGIDVPNATVMVIEHADRFGLAQLHQLRGRVGRGSAASTCIAIQDGDSPEASERLGVFATVTDGFALADKDLELRGFGRFFGTQQSGFDALRVADLSRDAGLLLLARRDAGEWIARSPLLNKPEEAVARRRLWRAHGEWLGLGDMG